MTRRQLARTLLGIAWCISAGTPAMARSDETFHPKAMPYAPTYSLSSFSMPSVTLRPVSIPNVTLQSPTLSFRSPVLSRPLVPPPAMMKAAGTFHGAQSSSALQATYRTTYSE